MFYPDSVDPRLMYCAYSWFSTNKFPLVIISSQGRTAHWVFIYFVLYPGHLKMVVNFPSLRQFMARDSYSHCKSGISSTLLFSQPYILLVLIVFMVFSLSSSLLHQMMFFSFNFSTTFHKKTLLSNLQLLLPKVHYIWRFWEACCEVRPRQDMLIMQFIWFDSKCSSVTATTLRRCLVDAADALLYVMHDHSLACNNGGHHIALLRDASSDDMEYHS